ncbi:hypothetical protein [Corticibacter populi]|uniref:hypothetical protein n=1 Tax=Corticibacter populi TaxID=1550736 RepID=UPI0013EE6A7D|nr:hypothetical protein [Corticibacter populi]
MNADCKKGCDLTGVQSHAPQAPLLDFHSTDMGNAWPRRKKHLFNSSTTTVFFLEEKK